MTDLTAEQLEELPDDELRKLHTDRQWTFKDEYIIDFNGARAARDSGYSEHTARAIASENLTKPYIQESIRRALEERSQRTRVTSDMVVAELAKMAFMDIRKAFDTDGSMLEIKDMPDEIAAAIEGFDISQVKMLEGANPDEGEAGEVSVLRQHILKVKLSSKSKNLELLGRHLGMFVDRTKFDDIEDLLLLVKHV